MDRKTALNGLKHFLLKVLTGTFKLLGLILKGLGSFFLLVLRAHADRNSNTLFKEEEEPVTRRVHKDAFPGYDFQGLEFVEVNEHGFPTGR